MLTFLTPLAAVVALAVVVPLAAFAVAARRVARVRSVLKLPPPARTVDARVLAALAAVVVALALAAAQPALSRTSTQRIRTDAEVLFVIDTSQSMAAAPGPHSPTRLDRATVAAERLRAAIPEVPSGVATLTDRVLPDLLPVADVGAFDATVRKAVAIEEPPPRALSLRATTFTPLAGVPRSGYFSPSARVRLIVLLTDGESGPFDPAAIGHTLTSSHTPFLAVRFWSANESVFEASGRPDPNYRPDPTGRLALASLASAAGGKAFEESELGAAAADLRSVVGHGPTRSVGRTRTTHPLAPYVAFAALLPLALVFRRRLPG